MCWCLCTFVFVCLFHHFEYSTSKLNAPNPALQLVKQNAYTQFFNSCGEILDYYELCALEIFQLSSFERAQHISTTFLPPLIFLFLFKHLFSCHKLYGCNDVVVVVVDGGGRKKKITTKNWREIFSRTGKANDKKKHARTQNEINFYILMLFFVRTKLKFKLKK